MNTALLQVEAAVAQRDRGWRPVPPRGPRQQRFQPRVQFTRHLLAQGSEDQIVRLTGIMHPVVELISQFLVHDQVPAGGHHRFHGTVSSGRDQLSHRLVLIGNDVVFCDFRKSIRPRGLRRRGLPESAQ